MIETAGAERHLAHARVHFARGDVTRARAAVDAGLALARGSGSAAEAGLLVVTARLRGWDWDPPAQREAAERALAVARASGAFVGAAEHVLAMSLYTAGDAACGDHARAALEASRREGDTDQELECLLNLAAVEHSYGDGRRALAWAEATERRAVELAKPMWETQAAWTAARFRHFCLGDAAAAASALERLASRPGLSVNAPQLLADLALAYADLGRYDEARAAADRAARAADTPYTRTFATFVRAEVEWSSGLLERALAAAAEALAGAVAAIDVAARSTRAWALYELRRPEGGEAGSVGHFREGTRAEFDAFTALAAGDLAAAEDAFRRAAAAWDGHLVRSVVRARWAAAEVALRRGDRARAREALLELETEAAAIAPLLARVRRTLRAFEGGRGRRPREGLSPREHEVLELVAAGLRSEAIARRCGIGRATVETHVRSAMAKLGARTRLHAVALAELVRPEPPPLEPGERELLALLASGATVADAAVRLGISRRTATRRLAAVRRRLDVATTAAAVAQIEDVADGRGS